MNMERGPVPKVKVYAPATYVEVDPSEVAKVHCVVVSPDKPTNVLAVLELKDGTFVTPTGEPAGQYLKAHHQTLIDYVKGQRSTIHRTDLLVQLLETGISSDASDDVKEKLKDIKTGCKDMQTNFQVGMEDLLSFEDFMVKCGVGTKDTTLTSLGDVGDMLKAIGNKPSAE